MNSKTPQPTDYDKVEYPVSIYAETDIDRLASVAKLLGMNPPNVESCRVLEIGCGEGLNMTSMAYNYPQSEFVGIDFAAAPIAKGVAFAAEAGVGNVTLKAMDLLDMDESWGQFDFILAHGFYAWVPPAVSAKYWEVCGKQLTPNGIVYTSYNAMPGGRIRQMTSEVMRYHLSQQPPKPDSEKSALAKNFFRRFVDSVGEKVAWKYIGQAELERISKTPENVLWHDELGPSFQPLYFSEFVESAEKVGLQYLAGAEFYQLSDERKRKVAAALGQEAVATPIQTEQYHDFLEYAAFRRTLLCKASVALDRDSMADKLLDCWVVSPLQRAEAEEDGTVKFQSAHTNKFFKTNDPRLIAILDHLSPIFPKAEPVRGLCTLTAPEGIEQDEPLMLSYLLDLALKKLLEIRTAPYRFGRDPKALPLVSAIARMQLAKGMPISALNHVLIKGVDETSRKLLLLLDGTRSVEELARLVCQMDPTLEPEKASTQIAHLLEMLQHARLLVQ